MAIEDWDELLTPDHRAVFERCKNIRLARMRMLDIMFGMGTVAFRNLSDYKLSRMLGVPPSEAARLRKSL